jgi:hypothetical protein
MLHTNQITNIRKNIFYQNQTIPEVVHGGVKGPKVKFFFTRSTKMNFFLNYIFLKFNSCSLLIVFDWCANYDISKKKFLIFLRQGPPYSKKLAQNFLLEIS